MIKPDYFSYFLTKEFAYSLIWCAFYFVSSLLMLIGGGVASVAGVSIFL